MSAARRLGLAAAVTAIALSACDLVGSSALRVESWTPGEGRFSRGEDLSVSVLFSVEPDRVSAEHAFSMTEDGAALGGSFSWEGRRLLFAPFYALGGGADFRVSVSEEAMTRGGASLLEALEGRFTTKLEDGRPRVAATFPTRGGALPDGAGQVSVTFSEAVDPASYRACLSFSPSIIGVWSLGAAGTEAAFSPLEPWRRGAEYECSVSGRLSDLSRNRMGEDYSFRFVAGDDVEAPTLTNAEAIDPSGAVAAALIPDDPSGGGLEDNPGWESGWRLRLRFSEPVSLRTLESRVGTEGGPPLSLETGGESSGCAVFRFDERPAFGSGFVVRLRPGIEDLLGNASEAEAAFRIRADGPGSRPPRLVGVRLPLSPGAALPEDRSLAAFAVDEPYATLLLDASAYPIGLATPSSIELYLELAEGASLDPISIMASFGLSATNGSLDFSARRVVLSCMEGQAPHAPWAGCAVARVDGLITNRVDSGVVTVSLSAGFKDSAGNPTEGAQLLALLK